MGITRDHHGVWTLESADAWARRMTWERISDGLTNLGLGTASSFGVWVFSFPFSHRLFSGEHSQEKRLLAVCLSFPQTTFTMPLFHDNLCGAYVFISTDLGYGKRMH